MKPKYMPVDPGYFELFEEEMEKESENDHKYDSFTLAPLTCQAGYNDCFIE